MKISSADSGNLLCDVHSASYGAISRTALKNAPCPKDTLFLPVVNAGSFHVSSVISRLITEERDLTPITDNTLRLMFRRLKTQANIPRIRAHLLRHTFATNFLQNGGDIYTLQQILGHTSLEMVKRYVHFTPVKVQSTHAKYSPLDKVLKA